MKTLLFPLLLPFLSLAIASQTTFSPPSTPIYTSSISLVDLLSSSPNHTLLLHAFQRARLIPLLNKLNGSTLFAPDDEAIKKAQKKEQEGEGKGLAVWSTLSTPMEKEETEVEEGKKPDNLQLALRDTLLYHILNYTLISPPSSPSNDSSNSTVPTPFDVEGEGEATITLPLDLITLQETLYYPSLFPLNSSYPKPPSLPGSPPSDPEDPDHPKHKKREGLLHGEGQKLRLLRKKDSEESFSIGGDWKGMNGRNVVWKGEGNNTRFAKNGAMISLEEVLEKPSDLSSLLLSHPSLSVLSSLLPPSLHSYISTASHLTLFAPTNTAFDQLPPLERRYLESGFAEDDLGVIFGSGASRSGPAEKEEGKGEGMVGYLERISNGTMKGNVTTILGNGLIVQKNNKGDYKVNGTTIEEGDILASNGVLHTVPSLLLAPGALSLTAEKYLIALNATRFVSLLRSVNLSSYVQVPSGTLDSVGTLRKRQAYTILAPRDDIISQFEVSAKSHGGKGLPAEGSEELKKILEYHILEGKWTKEDLEDGMLLGSVLKSEETGGKGQMVPVSVHEAEIGGSLRGMGWNDEVRMMNKEKGGGDGERKSGIVGFGGVNVLSDPIEIGGSIIYLPTAVLEPPAPFIQNAVSDLRLSTFVASVYAAALDKSLSNHPSVTYLVPDNKAFASLGLVMQYLLLPTSRAELRSLVRYHAIDGIVYLDGFPTTGTSKRFETLDGSEIYLERNKNSSAPLGVHGPTSGGLPVNGEGRSAIVKEGNVLTKTGVMHVIDQVELPPDMEIDLNKLLKGAKASTMVDLIRAANMSWILEGKQEPPPAEDEEEELEAMKLGKGKKHKKKNKKKKRKNENAEANRTRVAYTILCPTDKAFSRLNLTYYFANPTLLVDLVKLHIIPTDAFAALDSSDGKPLELTDEASYATLLDKKEGGTNQYGSLAFRRWGEDSWLVGIKSARGTNGESDHARVLDYGRATPALVNNDDPSMALLATTLALGGGVMTIDSVLLPYQAGWFRRFGWIVALVILGVATAVLIGLLTLKMWRGKKMDYEPLEGEED